MIVKRIRLFVNNNQLSKQIEQVLSSKLVNNGYELVNGECDLAIAIGGDGSFLRMVRQNNFDSSCFYIGINTGTLGFLQELDIQDIDVFIAYLNEGNYVYDYYDVQKTALFVGNKVSTETSLNEVVIRDSKLNAIGLQVYVEQQFLENYYGDGLLISTTIGSSAYNMSFGGSIVDFNLKTMQLTPIAPVTNHKYSNLKNSIVMPANKTITVVPNRNELLLTIDGENVVVQGVNRISISIEQDKIKSLKFKEVGLSHRISSKLLRNN